jgi:hypothetical protein
LIVDHGASMPAGLESAPASAIVDLPNETCFERYRHVTIAGHTRESAKKRQYRSALA